MADKRNLCASCGRDSVDEDNGQRVCTSCGAVAEEGVLTTDACSGISLSEFQCHTTGTASSMPADYLDKGVKDGPRRQTGGMRMGNAKIKQLVSFLGLKKVVEEEAILLFAKVLMDEEFFYRRNEYKEVIAAACLYSVASREQFPLSLTQMSETIGCSTQELHKARKELLLKFDVSMPAKDLDAIIEYQCQKSGLESIVELVQRIVSVSKETWVLTGRNPEHVICAASFLAWQSKDFLGRQNCGFEKFQKQFPVCQGKAAKSRLAELRSVLCKLSQTIPWIKPGEVKMKNLPLHLDDIVKFQKTFMARLRLQAQAQTKAEMHSDGANEVNENDEPSKKAGAEAGDLVKEVDNETQGMAVQSQTADNIAAVQSKTANNIAAANNVFLPASYKRNRLWDQLGISDDNKDGVVHATHDLNNEELCSDDDEDNEESFDGDSERVQSCLRKRRKRLRLETQPCN